MMLKAILQNHLYFSYIPLGKYFYMTAYEIEIILTRLLIGHHDPTLNEAQLNKIISSLKENNVYQFKYELAMEGMEFDLV